QEVASLMPGHDCVSGSVVEFDDDGSKQIRFASTALTAMNFVTRPADFFYHQPCVWVRGKLASAIGCFDPELHYKFDWEFMLRYLDRYPKVAYTERNLGFSRLHSSSKTMCQGEGFSKENWTARERVLCRLVSKQTKGELAKIVSRMHW